MAQPILFIQVIFNNTDNLYAPFMHPNSPQVSSSHDKNEKKYENEIIFCLLFYDKIYKKHYVDDRYAVTAAIITTVKKNPVTLLSRQCP